MKEIPMLLPNGSAIKNDVIESFNRAVKNNENIQSGEINWNFVESDMFMDLRMYYASEYIIECFDVLADNLEGVA
jgi:hypothetical protein